MRTIGLLLSIVLLGACGISPKSSETVLDLRTSYDFDICPLHNSRLEEGVEPIEYSHISFGYEYSGIRKRLFPLANIGDITHKEARTALVLYCPECRKAKEKWLMEWNEKECKKERNSE